ncbi:hypothetical protein ACHQM5_017887 [Ranunculus cassubicifolius]
MGLNGYVSISKLNRAVKKVSFILNFLKQWRISSMVGYSAVRRPRLLSFKEEESFHSFRDEFEADEEMAMGYELDDNDDINVKAEEFISKFYHHLQNERCMELQG